MMLLSTASRLFYLYDAASLMRSRIKSLLWLFIWN